MRSLTNVTDECQRCCAVRHQRPSAVAASSPLVSPSARPLSSLPLLEVSSKNAREGAFFTALNARQERKFGANEKGGQQVAQSAMGSK